MKVQVIDELSLGIESILGFEIEAGHVSSITLERDRIIVSQVTDRDREQDDHESTLASRGEIKGFSTSSRKRLARFLRNSQNDLPVMITLTYPSCFPSDGRAVKYHLKRFTDEVLEYWDQKGVPKSRQTLVWVMEFQERGAPHFHVLSSLGIEKEWVSRTWFRIVGTDDQRHLMFGTKIEKLRENREKMAKYVLKYAIKGEQKDIPCGYENAGRFWGVCGNRAVVAATMPISSFALLDENYRQAVNDYLGALSVACAWESAKALSIWRYSVVIFFGRPDSLLANSIRLGFDGLRNLNKFDDVISDDPTYDFLVGVD